MNGIKFSKASLNYKVTFSLSLILLLLLSCFFRTLVLRATATATATTVAATATTAAATTAATTPSTKGDEWNRIFKSQSELQGHFFIVTNSVAVV